MNDDHKLVELAVHAIVAVAMAPVMDRNTRELVPSMTDDEIRTFVLDQLKTYNVDVGNVTDEEINALISDYIEKCSKNLKTKG